MEPKLLHSLAVIGRTRVPPRPLTLRHPAAPGPLFVNPDLAQCVEALGSWGSRSSHSDSGGAGGDVAHVRFWFTDHELTPGVVDTLTRELGRVRGFAGLRLAKQPVTDWLGAWEMQLSVRRAAYPM